MGVRCSDTTSDATRVTTMTKASCPNRMLTRPFTKMMGRKMPMVVSVDAMTATPTSAVPRLLASFGSIPRSRWRVMFSSETMELSTTMPTARAMAMSETAFRV